MKQKLIDFYLDCLNNYLTIERFAEHHNISVGDCKVLLELGSKYNNEFKARLADTYDRIKKEIETKNN